ncbi:hypothetical protein TNIN_178331 [Trichonephila inaurata madagascariensis]|uniref:Uncharacterized protein n=1 Tax=Trichonephila inaurata madagascariensis TaxID=2747483 RepID=A0A8X6XH88_9ARAC|nr:hypothetical protein TNIN_178331 [Trichonephila inaurata madagascariensis]
MYYFEKGRKATLSFRHLNEHNGDGTIGESGCRKWNVHFKSVDTSLEDKPERGQLSNFDNQSLLAAVEGNEILTIRMWTFQPPFIVSKNLERYGNGLNVLLLPTNSAVTIQQMVSKF